MTPIQRLDTNIVKRILCILCYTPGLNRSQLARKSDVNWTQIERYLAYLYDLDLTILNKFNHVEITEFGRRYISKSL